MKTPETHSLFLSDEKIVTFLAALIHLPGLRWETNPKKHSWSVIDHDRTPILDIRLPLTFSPIPENTLLSEYLDKLDDIHPPYLIALIQAGAAALGYAENGEISLHKNIKKYMKRHKRGKAQISYLNSKGKSKAGSRIRLANTISFLEEINEKLTEWEEDYEPKRIMYSCSAQLWGLLFKSNIPPPFEKKDERLIKIPKDVHIPSLEELMAVNKFVKKGKLTFHGSHPELEELVALDA
ncbi:MAG: hypothetical protein AAGC85_25320 [Bacteroidota bacterium]